MSKKRIAVIALGGNALVNPKEKNSSISSQLKHVERALEPLFPLIKSHHVVICFGNGYQVGNILLRVEASLGKAYALPLEVCVAESEGEIGYLIEQALHNLLLKHHFTKPIVNLLTEVIVDPRDPSFKHPTKPIGPWYTRKQADRMKKKGFQMIHEAKRGYRRVVASPAPLNIENAPIIKQLLQHAIIIAVGGGGIPVIKERKKFRGASAVIDKDLAAARLAQDIGADFLLILTATNKVCLNYGKKNEQPLSTLTAKQAKHYLKEGHFPEGSMGPKIQAAINFLHHGGRKVIITSPSSASRALQGKDGTVITS